MAYEQIGLQGIFEMEGMDKGMQAYLSGINKLNGETEKSASGVMTSFNNMGQHVNSVAVKMGTAVAAGAAAVTAALAGFAVKGIEQAMDMEKQMSTIAALMSKTKDEVKPLADEIVRLGLDPKLMVDAKQAADAIQQLAKNGLSMQQILDGAARSTVLLANATGADFGSAADIATAAMKLFNIDAKDMDKAVSGIVSVTTNSKLTIQDYALALANGGGQAKAVGMSFNDFNTILAGTASYFSGGGDAATSLKTMLTRLAAPTDQGAKLMKQLGIEVFDAQGKMLPFPQVLANLQKGFNGTVTETVKLGGATKEQTKAAQHYMAIIQQTKQKLEDYRTGVAGVAQSENDKIVAVDRLNRTLKSAQDAYNALGITQGTTTTKSMKMTDELKNQYLTMLFGADATREAVALLDLGAEGFDKLQQQMAKTDATQQAATKMDNLAGVIEITKGMIDSISLSIGQAFLPMVTDMAKGVSQFISDNGQKFVDWFTNVAEGIRLLAEGSSSEINWAGIVPAGMVEPMQVLSDLIVQISVVLGDLANGMVGADYPWEVIFPPGVAQVAEAIAGGVQFVADHMAAFQGALAGVAALLASAGIYAALTALVGAIAAINLPIVALVAGAAALGAAWNTNWMGIRDVTLPIIEALGAGIKALTTEFMAWATGAQVGITWENIFPADLANVIYSISNAIIAVRDAFAPLTEAIVTSGPGALKEIEAFATGNQTSWTNVQAVWSGITATAVNVFNGLAPIVSTALTNFQAALAPWAESALAWLTQAVAAAPGKIAEWYTALSTAVGAHIGEWVSYLIGWSDPLVNWITTAINALGGKIGEWYTALTGYVSSHVGEWVNYLIGWSDPLINWISTAIGQLGGKVGEWYTALTGFVASHIGEWVSYLIDWSDPLLNWIDTAINALGGKIGLWYTALTTAVSGYIGEWVSYLIDWSDPLVNWIGTAVGGLGPKISEWYTTLTTTVASYVGDWVSYLLDWSDPLIDWITTAVTNLPTKVGEWYNALTGQISTWLASWLDYLLDWSDPLVDWIDTAIANLPAKISAWYTALTGFVAGHIGEWVTYLIDWSDPLINWIDTATTNAPLKIQTWYSGLVAEVSKNLPNWITSFQGWATGAVQWLSDATTNIIPKIAEFTGKLISLLAEKLPDWIAGFFDFAAAATDWISTAIAALPIALGLFLSKLITWIGGEGLQGITHEVVKWATAFLGWVDTELIPKVAPAMGRFFAELILGIGKITAGIGIYVALVGKAIIDTLMATNWQQVGIDLMTLLIKGISSLLSLMQATADGFVKAIQAKFEDVDWIGLGSQVMQYIVSGLSSMAGNLAAKAKELADATVEKFTSIDWKQIGVDAITLISNGTVATLSTLITGVNFIIADVVATWTAIDWAKLGTDLINAIKDAAVNAASSLYDSFQTIVETSKKKFTDFDWAAAGSAVVDGIKAGIEKAKAALMEKVQAICDAIIAKIKSALDWSSPAGKTIPAGEAIVDGIIVGLNNRTSKLMSTLNRILNGALDMVSSRFDDPSLKTQFDFLWFNDPNYLNTHALASFTDQLDDLNSQIQDLLSAGNVNLDLVDVNEIARLGMVNKDLDQRAKLLKFIQDNNLDPSAILNYQTLAYMQPDQIVRAIQNGMQQLVGMANYSLVQEQNRIQRAYDLRNVTTQTADQMERMQKLSTRPMNFFQQLQFKRAEDQFNSLTEQMQTARDNYISSGSSIAMATVQTLANAQEALLGQISNFQKHVFADQVKNEQLTAVFQQQMSMLDQAKALGYNLADLYNNFFNNTDNLASSALDKMGHLQDILATASVSMLQRQIAEKALLSSVSTNWNVSGVAQNFAKYYSDAILTPLLNNLRAVVMVENQRITALANYNNALKNVTTAQTKANQLDFLNNQINLLKQVAEAGMDVRQVFAGVLSGKSVLGDGANINDLLTIANQLQDQLIKKAQAQLTPQAIALTAQQQQVAEQKRQLDYLNRQLDIIHQGQQAGVNWEGFFSGLTVGINATEQDILTATARLYAKLIKQANMELGIASPSKVMMRVGNFMMQGLGVGIQQGFGDLSRMLSTSPASSVSSRTLNFNMGGVNVNNGMDQYVLESVIERVIERSFR